MSGLSIFDVAGPVMVGPSSSHTAGACKIGQFASALFHHKPTKVTFYLHGSFAEVYMGHATDKALLAGVMRFQTSDPRIKRSFTLAKAAGLEYEFIESDLGADAHPNTVMVVLENETEKMAVTGSSIGGGMIEITKIDDFPVLLKGTAGKRLSLVAMHDCSDEVSEAIVKKIESFDGVVVAEVTGSSFKDKRLSVFGIEGRRMTIPEVKELESSVAGLDFVRSLSKLQKQ